MPIFGIFSTFMSIGQEVVVEIPAALNETEVERQNEIKRKRHKMLYKSKHFAFTIALNTYIRDL